MLLHRDICETPHPWAHLHNSAGSRRSTRINLDLLLSKMCKSLLPLSTPLEGGLPHRESLPAPDLRSIRRGLGFSDLGQPTLFHCLLLELCEGHCLERL